MKRIRFLSFNIHGGRSLSGKRDVERIHRLMERFDIDVGVFQEMETRESKRARIGDVERLAGPSRPHHLIGPSMIEGDGWYGNLIVSRYPIRRGLVHNLETKTDFEPRNAVDALIETPLGDVRVIGTHLSLSYVERRSEAKNLLRLIREVEEKEKNPLFLMGDINEWQWSSQLLDYLDTALTPLPCHATFPAFLPMFHLDRVWYDGVDCMKVFAHRLDGKGIRFLSDHLPLVVEMERQA